MSLYARPFLVECKIEGDLTNVLVMAESEDDARAKVSEAYESDAPLDIINITNIFGGSVLVEMIVKRDFTVKFEELL